MAKNLREITRYRSESLGTADIRAFQRAVIYKEGGGTLNAQLLNTLRVSRERLLNPCNLGSVSFYVGPRQFLARWTEDGIQFETMKPVLTVNFDYEERMQPE